GGSLFFSGSRRHTRSYGDWSSDVCSSDLLLLRRRRWFTRWPTFSSIHMRPPPAPQQKPRSRWYGSISTRSTPGIASSTARGGSRSEERRVGRGGGAGWAVAECRQRSGEAD